MNASLDRRIFGAALTAIFATGAGTSSANATGTVATISVDLTSSEVTATTSGCTSDGSSIAFDSYATGIVTSDTNSLSDIFLSTGTGISLISIDSTGGMANGDSFSPSITSNGQFVLFSSIASDLVSGDTNGKYDAFLRDVSSGVTTRVSLSSSNSEANDDCFGLSISDDGRFVVFSSPATNLVTGDTNGFEDIFVRDRQNSTTIRISVTSGGGQSNGDSSLAKISGDGAFVAYSSEASNLVSSDSNSAVDVLLFEMGSGTVSLVSSDNSGVPANGGSLIGYTATSISEDGRYVVFSSDASNLISGDTNNATDVFVRDTVSNTTARVSVDSSGGQGVGGGARGGNCGISLDGRFVVFSANDMGLVTGDANGVPDVFLHDRLTGNTELISDDGSGPIGGVNPGAVSTGFATFGAQDYPASGIHPIMLWTETSVAYSQYGSGTTGSGSCVPLLDGDSGFGFAGTHAIDLSSALGGASCLLVIGSGNTPSSGYGGTIHVSSIITTLPLTASGTGACNGTIDIPGIDVTASAGVTVYMQFFVSDSSAFGGVALSNGLQMSIVP